MQISWKGSTALFLFLFQIVAVGGISLAQSTSTGLKLVGRDPAGDWGDAALAPLAAQSGQDLIEARIGLQDEVLRFVITLDGMATPELTPTNSYTWSFTDQGAESGAYYTLASSRSGEPGAFPFTLASCVSEEESIGGFLGTEASVCTELATVDALIDATTATIAVPVPMASFSVRPAFINAGATVVAASSVNTQVNETGTPSDKLTTNRRYRIKAP